MYSSSAPSPTRTKPSGFTRFLTFSNSSEIAMSDFIPTTASPHMSATSASVPSLRRSRQTLMASKRAFVSESSGSAMPRAVAASLQRSTPTTGVVTPAFLPKSSSLSTARTRSFPMAT